MSPPSATEPTNGSSGTPTDANIAPLEPGIAGDEALSKLKKLDFPKPPTFDDPYKERAYLKGRLAAAFRIFGKYGFDEGVAGHITLRVRLSVKPCISERWCNAIGEGKRLTAYVGSSRPNDLLGESIWGCLFVNQGIGFDTRQ